MRFFYLAVLLVVVAAVAVFAFQNNVAVTLRYFAWSLATSLPVLIAVVYLLGMVSGWTVVGFIKRSVQRVTEHDRR